MFLDTSGLFCLHNRAEPHHAQATRLLAAATRSFTHSYVIAEFVALSESHRLQRRPVLQFIQEIHDGDLAEVVFVDEATHRKAFDLLRKRDDKSWSLCDAVSFVLMGERKVSEALTLDHHFEQAGFVQLLNH